MEAVRQNSRALRFASEKLKRDREGVIEAVRQNGNALQYASQELTRDREVVSGDGGRQAEWLGASVCFGGAEASQGSRDR